MFPEYYMPSDISGIFNFQIHSNVKGVNNEKYNYIKKNKHTNIYVKKNN